MIFSGDSNMAKGPCMSLSMRRPSWKTYSTSSFFLKNAWIIAGVFLSRPTTRLTVSFSSFGRSPVRRATRRQFMT